MLYRKPTDIKTTNYCTNTHTIIFGLISQASTNFRQTPSNHVWVTYKQLNTAICKKHKRLHVCTKNKTLWLQLVNSFAHTKPSILSSQTTGTVTAQFEPHIIPSMELNNMDVPVEPLCTKVLCKWFPIGGADHKPFSLGKLYK